MRAAHDSTRNRIVTSRPALHCPSYRPERVSLKSNTTGRPLRSGIRYPIEEMRAAGHAGDDVDNLYVPAERSGIRYP
jgi:hypothetical protein